MTSRDKPGRFAGLLWFGSAVLGGFGLFYVRSNIIVSGDAAATAANVLASESMFRVAIVSTLFSQVLLFLFGVSLFHLFKEVHKVLATVLLTSILMTVAIAIVNQSNNLGALLVLSQADYLNVFNADQRNAMAMIFLRMGNTGQGLLEIFWTPYFFSFGLLVVKSRYVPKILGILMMIMSVGYALNVSTKFLIPHFHPALFTQLAMSLGALGGIPSILWLLIKGPKVERVAEPAP